MTFFRCSFSTILHISIVVIVQGAAFNICPWIYCENGGTCQQVENSLIGFQCRCQFGFNGLLCENRINITICVTNPCENRGNCTITTDRVVKCICPQSYTGRLCEAKISK